MTETPDKERTALLDQLGGQRRHVLGVLTGLSEADLRRAMLPSGWTCLALVRHLALDVERFWFGGVIAGDESVDFDDETGWQPPSGEPAEATFELYRQEIERADATLATVDLDAPPARWPAYFADWRLADAREIILHVITETATHAGHLDAVRELIDGRTWLGSAETQIDPDSG